MIERESDCLLERRVKHEDEGENPETRSTSPLRNDRSILSVAVNSTNNAQLPKACCIVAVGLLIIAGLEFVYFPPSTAWSATHYEPKAISPRVSNSERSVEKCDNEVTNLTSSVGSVEKSENVVTNSTSNIGNVEKSENEVTKLISNVTSVERSENEVTKLTSNVGRSTEISPGNKTNSGLPYDFRDYLLANNFDIDGFVDEKNYPKLSSEVTKMLYLLADYIQRPPPAEIKVEKRPDPLPRPADINCSDGYFKGKRNESAHIVDVILFGYELDLLEIRLFELDEVVDQFVIWESGFSQRSDRKPLLFANNWKRFARFAKKIVHIVQDDADIPNMQRPPQERLKPTDNWNNEARMRFHAIEGWVKYMGGETKIPSNHLLIVGDLDEMPSALSIQAFKYCKMPGPTAAFHTTLWRFDLEHVIPMGSLTSKWYGYWSQPMISKVGLGVRHSRENIVPFEKYSGAHMNRCLRPASFAFKGLCTAEGGPAPPNGDIVAQYFHSRCLWLTTKKSLSPEQFPHPNYVPWFPKANPDRFPYLFPSKNPEYAPTCK